MPKYGPHGAFAIGIVTFPPSALSAWNTRSAFHPFSCRRPSSGRCNAALSRGGAGSNAALAPVRAVAV